jgi:HAD superfamily hydrolase (TIGR01509 family)
MIPDAPQVLAGLKEAGYRLGLLSNTMFTGQAHIADLSRFGLDGYFDAMLFSADVGKWKPTAAPFLQVAEELEVGPATAVYIGDDPASDIVGGRRAGMRTIHFQSSDRFPTPNGVIPHARIERLVELPDALTVIGKR